MEERGPERKKVREEEEEERDTFCMRAWKETITLATVTASAWSRLCPTCSTWKERGGGKNGRERRPVKQDRPTGESRKSTRPGAVGASSCVC